MGWCKNMNLKQFLKPNLKKILIMIAIPYIWFGLTLLAQQIYLSAQKTQGVLVLPVPTNIYLSIPITILSFLIESIFYYPMACSISIIYTNYRNKQIDKITKNRSLFISLIFAILIFNPIVIRIILVLLIYSLIIL